MRYYPQLRIAESHAAIIAETGLPPESPMSDVFRCYTPLEGGWRKVRTARAEHPPGVKPKKRLGGKRQVPHAVIERINALRRRLLRMGDRERAEECRLAIDKLQRWGE